ncbi:uncharacterized protein BP5553_01636 [Venustampulla echinocandica]|uniref:Cysteine dioxygenase n=1 Tax=Venustampulla echinocandica TaxID=2656787 RepID=A0A370U1L4_9HELO|nr:uncharacterized protein BP5553_01636 [Venustampulla echinocandica]RDL41657.1 hypothetical protein BP5553_01636 [Venustampulla echinocandica]
MSSLKSATMRSLRSKPLTNSSRRILTTTGRNVGMGATTRNAPTYAPTTTSHPDYPPSYTPSYPPNDLPGFANTSLYPKQTPFNNLLTSLTATLTNPNKSSMPTLHNLLRGYTSDPTHWSKYAHANPDKLYTRNLVCELPGVFNLMLLVWTPGKILQGSITETRFATPSSPGQQGPLVQTSNKNFGLNQVSYMADILGLHEISNPHPTEYAVSLHLYTPPNAALHGCHVYDPHDGSVKHVMQSPYDSICGVVQQ